MIIAFDLDGTLISCESRQSAVLQSVVNALSIDCDVQKIWENKRNGAATEAALVKNGVAASTAGQIAERWKQLVEEPYWLSLDSLFVGTKDLLEKLKRQGHHLHLLTARSRADLLSQQLLQLGIGDLFAQVHVVQPVQARDQKAARLKLIAAQCFIGDTESDFHAARAAEVSFYAVTTGQRNESYLRSQGVTQLFSTLQDAISRMQ